MPLWFNWGAIFILLETSKRPLNTAQKFATSYKILKSADML